MLDHSLNPSHVSEGGTELQSEWGNALKSMRLQGPITVLPHESLMFAGRVGVAPVPATARPSLPYINDSPGGPVSLKQR